MCGSWSFFFFRQKTAYEMRISDWSSDVCSSDLSQTGRTHPPAARLCRRRNHARRSRAGAVNGGGRAQERPGCRWHVVGQDHACQRALERNGRARRADRKGGVSGKSVSVRVDLGGRRINKKKKK